MGTLASALNVKTAINNADGSVIDTFMTFDLCYFMPNQYKG
ncbi:hypothetical protein YPPY66_2960 [Yersinia pestis PY-66]|uniref:Uncharacterized protein n=1 Tax=Yersinia pestis TaxID=632 RepID=Q8CL70_YERPE|nr:hypothetical [Yersinia pestis KIM10+]EIQ87796.1 hypothetical protein YPPY01_2650 [Yersinia pestis PY-01]EIR48538.1 hypothetical protein YPPY14_2676 [Yersinia pestis PY-14]EIS03863.1 hypothetical protein YPPY46_2698 [Yersinia pestis PY-46]EIS04413.1 hypothetical protein YPPY47_2801 [Yersinia pestis PY-47]EIS18079.1 hypothetical protein YPPY53_2771 [Yersinia pestis PY-53]EIS31634.1 hypothetical protein YPPY56_2769 [Yersinia pestis PY-56]EIS66814.1 hypothetical protein YPPY65_2740 [Yersinia 